MQSATLSADGHLYVRQIPRTIITTFLKGNCNTPRGALLFYEKDSKRLIGVDVKQ